MKCTLLQIGAVLSFIGASNAQAEPWGQCGGGTVGNIGCVTGYCCQFVSEFYSQCLQSCTGSSTTTTKKSTTTLITTGISSIKTTTSTKTTTTLSKTSTSSTSIVVTSKTTTASGSGSTATSAVDQLVGYGAGTTGGGSGSGTTVTTCAALIVAIANGGVVKINGIISGCGIIRIPGNTTILGIGANSGITLGGFKVTTTSNVIVRNLKFFMAIEGGDLFAIEKATKVWVDHCEFYNAGIVGDKDYYDGLLDVVLGSDFITISWNKFHDHWKGSLVGNSDGAAATDKGKLHITYHHNSFTNIFSRLPSNRFGSIHVYNCCYKDILTSAIHVRMGGQVLVENTSFQDVNRAIVTDYNSASQAEEGFAVERGNLFLGNSPISISQTNGFSAPYLYSLDPVGSICATIASKAGTGVVTF